MKQQLEMLTATVNLVAFQAYTAQHQCSSETLSSLAAGFYGNPFSSSIGPALRTAHLDSYEKRERTPSNQNEV